MVTACTIVARNYLPHARVLAASFLALHPGGEFFVLVIDDETHELDTTGEAFRPLRLKDIGLTLGQIGKLAGIYDVTELATAVKPPLLRWLLGGGRASVIYLDPDIKIFTPLDEVARLAAEHHIVLTPHTMVPVPRDNRRIDGLHILGSGVYNLGFIALGPGSSAFVDWWWDNTRREALVDHERMMFTDQRWIDFVPSFFDHHILKHPGYNVAYWNLHGRDLRWTGERYEVDGEPLYFFHFSGFDHRRPYLLSKHQGDMPRILLSERPDLLRLCGEYRAELEAAGINETSQLGYGWSRLPNGFQPDRHTRRLYWSALVAHEREGKPEPPNPFDPETVDRFMDWLNEPGSTGPRDLSRYLYAIYLQRPDLQLAFPDLPGEDLGRFCAWIHVDGVTQEQIDTRLLPPAAGSSRAHTYARPDQLVHGVNVAGYLRAELGIGEAARLMLRTLDHAGVPTSTITYDDTSSRQEHDFTGRGDGRAVHDVNLVCVNADRTPHFARDMGRGFFNGRHNAGYWFWELEHFPESMYPGFAYVDEVWCATRFITGAITAANQRPVHTVPVPVPIPETDPAVTRASLGLPDRFLFLFIFDFFSIIERKNPIGLVRAFCQAFKPGEGPVLILKTINGHRRLNDLERLKHAIGDRTDIRVIDEYYSASEKNALLGLADCYVSLHRSEGLGLTMAEAMGLGKPVIATGYSGNLDFMSPENSFLVDYTTVRVPPGSDPYTPGSPWADPSVNSAAEWMRRVVEDPAESARRARLGRQTITSHHGVDACAPVLLKRLDALRARDRQRAPSPGPAVVPPSALNQAAPPPVDETLQTAASLLTPSAGLPVTARLRGPRLRLQETLFRVLRPYWWQQRSLNETLIQAVRGVNERRAADAHALHVQAIKRVEEVEARLAERVDRTEKVLETLAHNGSSGSRGPTPAASPDRPATADAAGEARQTAAREREQIIERVETAEQSVRRLADVLADMNPVQQAAAAFRERAAEHLADLTVRVGEVAAETRTLSQRLYAAPYVAQADALAYTDEHGQPQMGFRANPGRAEAFYRGFEDIFRGDESFIRERFRAYLPFLQDRRAVLDVGCGRGELLELLRDEGLRARGVDLDPGMVERCRSKGLDVTHADALEYLRGLPEGSETAIVAAQFIEHIPHDLLVEFFGVCHSRLAPGGLLIAETVNPHSIEAFKTFWTDLSHHAPIFPEVALALCRLQGYSRARVVFPHGTGTLEDDRKTCGEYAVIAIR